MKQVYKKPMKMSKLIFESTMIRYKLLLYIDEFWFQFFISTCHSEVFILFLVKFYEILY